MSFARQSSTVQGFVAHSMASCSSQGTGADDDDDSVSLSATSSESSPRLPFARMENVSSGRSVVNPSPANSSSASGRDTRDTSFPHASMVSDGMPAGRLRRVTLPSKERSIKARVIVVVGTGG